MRRILIVLKDSETAERLKEQVASLGYKVYVARSVEKALVMYAEEGHDLVLAELDLPGGKGGDKLCIDIKSSFPQNNTFVILACGATDAELKKCGRSGADSYLRTPIDPDEAAQRINTILKKIDWRAPRVLVKIRVESSLHSQEFYGTTKNISSTGMLLETEKSLARNDLIHCAFYLLDQERIVTPCRVVRVSKAIGGMHTYGTEFTELDNSQQDIISEFIIREREAGNMI